MPNDFLDYMRQAPQNAWGVTSPSGGWAGSSRMQQPTWADLGGQYGGRAGAMVGGMADRVSSPQAMGFWASTAGTSAMQVGRQNYNQGSLDLVMQASAESLQRRIAASIRAGGFKGTEAQLQGAARIGADNDLIRGAVGGGYMTAEGASDLAGGLASSRNGWTPTTREVMQQHKAFEAYYGFGGNAKVNYGRTLGRSQDELAAITAETRRRMDPSAIERERIAARGDLARFQRTEMAAAGAEAFGISKEAWREDYEGAGGTEGQLKRLAARTGKTPNAVKELMQKAQAAAAVTADVADPTIEGMLDKRLMAQSGTTNKMLGHFESAGFTGGIKKLYQFLENEVGDETLDPRKMEALSERLNGITKATGMTLKNVVHLMQAIQQGSSGINLDATSASKIAGAAASLVGDGRGFTAAQQAARTADMASAMADPSKSRAAVQAGMLQFSGDARYAEYLRVSKTDPVAAQAMLDDATYSKIPGGAKGIATALAMGDDDLANMGLQALQEQGRRDAMEYNGLLGKTDAASTKRREELSGKLKGSNASFDATTGEASSSSRIFENKAAAAAQARQQISAVSPELANELEAAGRKLLADPNATREQAMAAGAALAGQTQGQGYNLDSGLRSARGILEAQGVSLKNGQTGADFADMAGTLARARAAGGPDAFHAQFGTMAVEAMTEKQMLADEARRRRLAGASDLGKIGGSLQRALSGAATGTTASALLEAMGAGDDPTLKAFVGQVMDGGKGTEAEKIERRSKILSNIQVMAEAQKEQESLGTTAKDEEARSAAKTKYNLALEAASKEEGMKRETLVEMADKTARGELAGASGAMDRSNAANAEFMKMEGTLLVTLVDSDGKRREGSGKLEGKGETNKGGSTASTGDQP